MSTLSRMRDAANRPRRACPPLQASFAASLAASLAASFTASLLIALPAAARPDAAAALTQPPVQPPTPPLVQPLTQQLVVDRAAELYAARLTDFTLDADARFTARVNAIALPLIAQARRDYPDTAGWAWEIHTTNDPDQNADCMAGGKILVSLAYVQRLELGDAELAMLLAHEIEHAALHHNLKEYQQAMRLDPRWSQRPFVELEYAVDHDNQLIGQLATTNHEQEAEADREGMLLAWRAGWPAARLATYFRKMYRASDWPRSSKPDYPSPLQRWQAARDLANTLQKNYVQAPD